MADIELLIKIPEKIYKSILDINALGCGISDIKNIIRNGTPKQKTGQWWERNTYPQESRSWDCSECQEIVFEKTNYCPNCGTKMEVEE